jgi:RNA polymerase sigma-70 factor (ECF subfamily)
LRANKLTIAKITEMRVSGKEAAESEAAEFERLMRPHFDRMYRLACRFTRSVPDAEDLLQDVLVSLFERREPLAEIADLKTWLARVIHNRFIDQRRTFLRRRLTAAFRPTGSRDGMSILEQTPSSDMGPEEQSALASQLGQLDKALGQLNDEQRIVVLLHDAEGYSLEEVQQITASAAGTVKSRLHRGRARLRELLGEGTFFA